MCHTLDCVFKKSYEDSEVPLDKVVVYSSSSNEYI